MELLLPERRPLDEAQVRDLYAPDPTAPAVRANFVSSLDGAVEVDGYSRGLSGPVDQAVFALLRRHADAVLVGAGTLRHEGYGPVRADRFGGGHPTLVVASAALDLDAAARPFAEAPVRPIVLTHDGAPADRRAALAEVADVVSCGQSVVDLAEGLSELRRRGLNQVLCEGGPHLFAGLLAADLVDELCLTVSPLLVGAGPSRIVLGAGRADPQSMRLAHLILAEGMLLTRYVRA